VAVETHSDRRVALRVCKPSEFGALLLLYTGSDAHTEQLHAIAKSQGEALTPCGPVGASGMYSTEDADEAAVYAHFGLPWIPPELREGRGEIEAAKEGRLPLLLEQKDVLGILHAHTTWSDGLNTVQQMAEAAHRLGYRYHGVTDHSQALAMVRGLSVEKLVDQAAEIDAVNATFTDGFRVLKGIECDILPDGQMDLDLDALNKLDIVVASVHSQQRQDRETISARVVRALESGVVDILGHPTGRILGMRDSSAIDMERVIDAAAANRVALEINCYPDRLDLSDHWARRAAEKGVLISMNTDAHRIEHLTMLRFGVGIARRAWLEPENVINCWPLDRLMGWLENRTR
jgi:DNA polymerase (family 10)